MISPSTSANQKKKHYRNTKKFIKNYNPADSLTGRKAGVCWDRKLLSLIYYLLMLPMMVYNDNINRSYHMQGGIRMLKIVIIDDERATRQKLIENIEWNKLNIEVAGEAKDGVEGLELVDRVSPDIVLLDVKMPKMNGIECATGIRMKNPFCKVIFLSGFTDKEYLKSAIHLNAVDYIEKPIDLDELHTVLKKTVLILSEEYVRKAKEKEISLKLEQNKALIRQELALSILSRNPELSNLKKELENVQANLSLNDNYRCILLRMNVHRALSAEAHILFKKEKVLDVIYSEFDRASIPCLAGIMDGTHAVVHVWGKAAENTLLMKEAVKRAQNSLDMLFQCKGFITAGVGMLVRGMENIHKSFRNAQKALKKSFLAGYESINFHDDEFTPEFGIQPHDINQRLSEYLRHGSPEKAGLFLEELVPEIKAKADSILVNHVKEIFLSLMLQVTATAKENGLNIGEEWNSRQLQWAEILNTNTVDEAAGFLLDKLELLSKHMEEHRGKSRKIRSAMEFIREHYSESISVVIIADAVGVTPTYLSTLFKKETGKALGEYIESVRIEKARELLKDDRLKLAEVSQLVGYNNANYFATVFKKATGVYPSDYRRHAL